MKNDSKQFIFLSEEELNELIKKKRKLINIALRRLKIYREHDDFIQEGLRGLLYAIQRYDATKDKDNSFDKFAYHMILNYMKNHLYKVNKWHTREQGVGDDDFLLETEIVPSSDYLIESKLDYEAITQLLTPIERLILDLRLDGYTNKEIAEHLDLSLEQVKYQRKLIRSKARHVLNDE